MALRRPLRPAHDGAIRRAVARGPVARAVANGERNTHDWTAGKDALLKNVRRSRHHLGLHGAKRRRLHRRPEEFPAGVAGLRVVLGGRRRRHGQPRGQSRFIPHSRTRHARTARLLHEPRRAAQTRRGPQTLALRLRAHRTAAVRRRRNRHARRQSSAWPNGRTARNRCCR